MIKNAQYQNLISFYKFVLRDYSKQFLFLTLLILLTSTLDLFGFIAIIPILGGFFDPNYFINNDSIFLKLVSFFGFSPTIIKLIFLVAIIFVTKSIFMFFSIFYQEKIRIDVYMDIRTNVYKNYLQSKWDYIIKQKVGEIINIISIQARNAATGMKHLAQFLTSIIFISFLTLSSLMISWQIISICIIISVIVFISVNPMYRISGNLGKEIGFNENIINQIAVNTITSPKYIKSAGLENFFIRKFNYIIEKTKQIEIRSFKINTFLKVLIEPVGILLSLTILYVAVIYMQKPIEYVVILVIIMLKLYQKIGVLPRAYAGIQYYFPLYKMCDDLIVNSEKEQEKDIAQQGNNLEEILSVDSIELKNISFSYPGENTNNVLLNISIKIKKGEYIGITGVSGSGKTTLIDLILGLIKPTNGSLNINGLSLEKYATPSWRRKIGYVSQDSAIFPLSIKDNIIMGEKDFDETKLNDVIQMSDLDSFIKKQPLGYNEIIGESGVTLSGGEKQRISLARTLYRNPEILILDEATSNLDNYSERKIQNSINNLSETLTIIAIAHRLKTLENCDRIIHISKGSIIEEGTLNDLINMKGHFSELIEEGRIKS
jgi:ABC-type multidrug transport system fused ATPase/permease subunit